jgi:hypothetical protein
MARWSYIEHTEDKALGVEREFTSLLWSNRLPKSLERVFEDCERFGVERFLAITTLAPILIELSVRSHPVLDEAREAVEHLLQSRSSDANPNLIDLQALLRKAHEISVRFPKPPRAPRRKIGDVYQIPLMAGGFAYVHYVHNLEKSGPLVSVFSRTSDFPLSLDELDPKDVMFGPLKCFTVIPLREGAWQLLGQIPVIDFVMPRFLTHYAETGTWWVNDGEQSMKFTSSLPIEFHHLEKNVINVGSSLEARIMKEIAQKM